MKSNKHIWIIGLGVTLLVIVIPIFIFLPRASSAPKDPKDSVATYSTHTDHKDIVRGTFETGQQVTQACLVCHPDSATELMGTSHWTWESEPFNLPWRDEPTTIGKINQINNFCIGAQGNSKRCATCHTGYDWPDYGAYDFSNSSNVDCLVCHADTALYAKGDYGNPAEGIDLLAAAKSVRAPTRENCGQCHFDGGGGNGVKHGDLDESLYFPNADLDVHMGAQDFLCISCHRTENHDIKGRLVADNYQVDPAEQVACTDCHAETTHEDDRINNHSVSVACQTCHVPSIALKDPTKMSWDWSTAGQDIPDDHYTYLKIKGSFVYDKNVQPTYTWFNGNLDYRYILEDKIDPSQPTMINDPAGDIDDPDAKIFPFKLHVAKQPYDTNYNHLLQPITAGEDGYWTNFDWDQAFQLAEERMGLPYSGEYDFAETWMYWPSTHMVQPKEKALQCADCHGDEGRLDWEALGYNGDPMSWGGRFSDRKSLPGN